VTCGKRAGRRRREGAGEQQGSRTQLQVVTVVKKQRMTRTSENSQHRHRAVTSLAIAQRNGIPFEVARVTCATCGQLLDERPLRRTAA